VTTKTLTKEALSVIDHYQHFKFGNAVCSVPYFNNKIARQRAGLRVNIGKGSPEEILDEVQTIKLKNHVDADLITSETLKKLLVDNNIGIDCSGFAYYVLNAESEALQKGRLSRKLRFMNCRGIFGKVYCWLRPVANCDVATLANTKNSRVVRLIDIKPGDMITMIDREKSSRNHILIIDRVEMETSIPSKVYYSHAVAYPEDGLYGSGIKQGMIEITNPDASIIGQRWSENGKFAEENRIFVRAQQSNTEIRRLNWF